MKKKRKILEPLGDLKHRLQADRNELTRICLHLRDIRGLPNMSYLSVFENQLLKDMEQELEKFNAERLGDLWDKINLIIEQEDVK